MHYEITPTVRLLIIAEIYGLTDAELQAAFKSAKFGGETVDHAPAAGFSFDFFGAAPRRGHVDAVRDLRRCQAVPRTFATVLSPSMLLLPIQIPHTKNWRSGASSAHHEPVAWGERAPT